MKTRTWMMLVAAGLVAACAGSATPGGPGDDAGATDEANDLGGTAEDLPAEDAGLVDVGAPDPDPGPADPGAPDLGPPDLGPPPDPGPQDVGPPPDPGQPDLGPPPDTGPQYSETVAACIYVLTSLCDKFIKRCDDMAFNWIPDEWLLACADFLAQQDDLLAQACLQIDNIESSDPNVAMIKTFGPLALRECVDHFECTFQTVGVIADFIMPLIQGQKMDTAQILALVTDLCFKD